MSQAPHDKSKYQTSTRRQMSTVRQRGLAIALTVLAILCLVIVVLAFLVATGEITLR